MEDGDPQLDMFAALGGSLGERDLCTLQLGTYILDASKKGNKGLSGSYWWKSEQKCWLRP